MKELGVYLVPDPRHSLRERVHIIADVGFDHIAIHGIEPLLDDSAEGFRKSAEREHLPIDNIHLTGPGTSLVWYPGPEGDEIVERHCKEMDKAMEYGIDLGVAHATYGLQMPPFNQMGVDRLRRIADHADKIGFTICFENHISLEHLLPVFDFVKDNPHVAFCFDTGHWNEFCVESDIYDKLSHLMKVTHLNDNDGVKDLHIIPFDGCTDFEKIAGSMKGLNRLTFEVKGVHSRTIERTAEQLRKRMRRMSIIDNEELVKVYDGGYHMYPSLTYEMFMRRLHDSGLKLIKMIEAAPDKKA